MPHELPGDQPQICASPGCDEVVVQSDPGSKRLYHSAECRRKARRLRRGHRSEADTADLPTVAPTPGRPAAELAAAAELAPAAELVPAGRAASAESASAESAAAGLPESEEFPGSGAGNDAVTTPEDHDGTDAAEDPGDSEFWKPGNGEADGFWDDDEDSPRNGARSPGRHRSPASQGSRLRRSHAVAIALTLAASAAGLGLIFSQSGPRHPLASDVQLHPPGLGGAQPSSSSSSSPAGHARTRHVSHHAAGATGHPPRPPATSLSPPSATSSPAPSPTPSRTSSPESPKPSPSPTRTPRVPSGLISFENGADGWKPLYGSIRSSQSTWIAYSGSHSLRITLGGADAAVGVENGSISRLRPGDTVTYRIYSDGQSGGRVGVFAETWNQPEDVAEVIPLPTHRGWFSLAWVVPSVSHVDAIGIQVAHHGSGNLTLAIDALSWTGS
jgi:hypothetical protein